MAINRKNTVLHTRDDAAYVMIVPLTWFILVYCLAIDAEARKGDDVGG